MRTVLLVEEVTKQYGGAAVLQDVSMRVNRGEIVAIIGPNGAGKSTYLRLIDLIERPTSGSILFNGEDTSGPDGKRLGLRRKIGMVFQQPVLFNMNVIQNVAYPLRIRGISKRDANTRALKAIGEVGLSALAARNALTLSGGEAQRVALSRAMVTDPSILLLDEPTGNLDPVNTGIIERVVKDRNRQNGLPIVFATHSLSQARRLSTKTAFFLKGQLLEFSDTKNFFGTPQDERTKQYVTSELVT